MTNTEQSLAKKNAQLEQELAIKNRELQIEAALDRIRAKAIAMHSSEDLASAISVSYHELKLLSVIPRRCGLILIDKETRSADLSIMLSSATSDSVEFLGKIKLEKHPVLESIYENWSLQQEYHPVLHGNEINEYYQVLKSQISFPYYPADTVQYGYYFNFKEGAVYTWTNKELAEHDLNLYRRFSCVISLTYRRYKDLKDAESRVRKAQIEVSLERVRSRSLAMQKSDELKDVVKVVFENLLSLGIKNIDSVNINILHKGSKEFDLWLAAPGQDYTHNFRLPYFDHPITNDFFAAMETGRMLHKKTYGYEQKNEFFKYMFENSDNRYLPEERKALILNGAAYSVSAAITDHSSIFVHNYNGVPLSEEDDEILISFSQVFDQAYNRYLDLHKAELLMREVVKQASLDRIRAQVASMRSTEDLQRIIPLMWQELSRQNIPFIRCGVFIMDETESMIHAYLSAPDGQALGVLDLPFNTDDVTTKTVDNWRRKEVFRHHWSKAEFIHWMQSMIDQGQVHDVETFQGGMEIPESLNLHGIPFMQGMLYVGSRQPLSIDELDTVTPLAEAFSVAYARYEDFTKLEKAKRSIEATLAELKATQAQLIQSEKMASLGELTAGIAHEIQNPLNFVKNFSEVNKEMLEEFKAERLKSKAERDDKLENEIIRNLIENEEKINHHVKRADAIVKGMLQHSRKSTGQTEPTDINKLADEYLRLSYHGLRAKDKSFNAGFKTDFDESVNAINIVPQDIGRVLLNLFNNAFYAVNEKKKASDENYQPSVFVQTKKINNKVEIRVKDNGNGIPPSIVDKIFQPFFTTKPTGQGTGLGLSLAYDIIKAHGGELRVETEENKGSAFTIEIPAK